MINRILLFLLLLLVSGCAMKRGQYDVPDIPLPGQYRNAARNLPAPTTIIPRSTPKRLEIFDSTNGGVPSTVPNWSKSLTGD